MNILPFPIPRTESLNSAASVIEIFAHLESVPRAVILFVDESQFCRSYTEVPWIKAHGVSVVDLDRDILDAFEIEKVPTYQFYILGQLVGNLIGTASESEFIEIKNELFQNQDILKEQKELFTVV